MMPPRDIQILEPIRETAKWTNLRRYKPRREVYWWWLQHVVFWILVQKEMEILYRQHEEGATVYLGAQEFTKLIREMDFATQCFGQYAFGWNLPLRCGDGAIRLMGLDVVVLPWMSGVLVVPESKKPRRG